MKEKQPDNAEEGYKCPRCGAGFGHEGKLTAVCPFCSMLCDETSCRQIVISNEEY